MTKLSPNVRVTAVVVTRDRLPLLKQCLDALREQTRVPDGVLIIDNASSDGTEAFLADAEPGIRVVRSAENIGGAGGFNRGIALARQHGHDWIWLMDDDTIPSPDALEQLLTAQQEAPTPPVVLASRVTWTDGTPHPMNQPWPKQDDPALLSAVATGMLPLRACSFVSALIHRDAVDRHGLPHAHYFIWNDDLEYTARILRKETGYWVPASHVEHRTARPVSSAGATGPRFYYAIRNRLFMLRSRSWSTLEKARLARHLISNIKGYLQANNWSREARQLVGRGVRDGLGRQP
jgi:rhamnopyranosyl-N-acetylglucosaminyl-diphospho-decaprenol beta-1,3/1,4-galactofuranosyltransferase